MVVLLFYNNALNIFGQKGTPNNEVATTLYISEWAG